MTYFKINNNDYSMYVNELRIAKDHLYKSTANAAGNTVVKYINSKRTLQVGIIPLDSEAMAQLQIDLDKFQVLISYQDPETNILRENVKCIIPSNTVEYYTIQTDKVMYKAFSFQIKEL